MEKLDLKSKNLCEDNIDKIAKLFPSCVTESADKNGNLRKSIDFDELRSELGDDVASGSESYEFNWVGKSAAKAEANTLSNKTLRPVKEDSVNWDDTENLYIEGDNLEVLKLLQESYLGKVKMIYIDPPYNTGNDFIYKDDFKKSSGEYAEDAGEITEEGDRLVKNNDSNGRFHSDWCSMMYSRLKLAKNLLSEDGVIFISIDDNEQSNLIKILDEVLGESNKIAEFVVVRAEGGGLAKQVIKGHDYLFAYSKSINDFTPLGRVKDIRGKIIKKDGETYWIQEDWLRKEFGKYGNCHYEEIEKYKGKAKLEEIENGIKDGNYVLIPKKNGMNIVGRLRNINEDASKFYSVLKYLSAKGIEELKSLNLNNYFDYPKSVELLNELILGSTFFTKNKSDVILDFFSGSATTAHATMKLNAEDGGNRKFIMVQLPEKTDEKSEAYKAGYKNICEIGKERIRRAAKKIHEDNPDAKFDDGFRVLKLDSSNYEDVTDFVGETNQETILDNINNIKDDRTAEDLLFNCLISWGVTLDRSCTEMQICEHKVLNYDEGSLVACFDDNISEDLVKEIADMHPMRVVFRDSSFKDCADRINVENIFKELSPNTKCKVI